MPDDGTGGMTSHLPPPLTGGSGGSGGTGGSDADAAVEEDAAVPQLPPNFTLECGSAGVEEASPELFAAWQADREDHAIGQSAAFSARGATYRVNGATSARVEAPLALHALDGYLGFVTLEDAQIETIDEQGRVELYFGNSMGGVVEASTGALESVPLEVIEVDAGLLSGALPLEPERIGNGYRYHADVAFADLAFDDSTLLYLYPEATPDIADRIEWMPTGPVVVQAASRMSFYDAAEVSVEKDLSDPVELGYTAFSLAGDFTEGSLEIEGEAIQGTPVAVFGSSAELTLGAASVEAQGHFQITQAVNEVGLVIPAEVEIVPEAREIWVSPGDERVIQLHYRERSYRGDAVLGEIQVGGAAGDLLQLKTGFRLALTEQIVGAIIDTGWAAPLAALASIPTVSIVFFVDIFSCIFGGCSDGPSLEPFPIWMQAGEIGASEVLVKGDLAVGTYEAAITFVGRNYCPVTVPLTIHIGEPPVDGGTDAMVDGGDAAP